VLPLALLLAAGCTTDLPPDAEWPDRRDPVGGDLPLAYVTNNGSDSISVIELATMTEVARRSIGMSPVDPEAPHHLAIDPATGRVWVGLSNVGLVEGGGLHGSHGTGVLPSYLQRLDLDHLAADEETRVDANLGDVVLAPGSRILTTHFDLDRALEVASMMLPPEDGWGALVIVDGESMERLARLPMCTAPHGVAVTRDGSLAIAACYGDDGVAFVDLAASPPTVLARVPVGPMPGTVTALRHGPYAVTLSPDESFALVGCLDGTSVRRIDVAARSDVPAQAVVLEGAAYFGAFDPAGARYWVPTQGGDQVALIDVATSAVTMRRRFAPGECPAPHEAIYLASLDRVFVVCEGDHRGPGSVVELHPDTLELLRSVEVGVYPDAIRVVEAP
jgi:YVTN family beta-propeller protein